jgi:hypothetical protein
MIITEYECKKCKHAFTRLFKDVGEKESLKEKCINCGNKEIKELQSVDLPEGKPDCNTCPKRSSGCGK